MITIDYPHITFQLPGVSTNSAPGEVEALGVALDLLKTSAENVDIVYKHAANKRTHEDNHLLDSFDPAVS